MSKFILLPKPVEITSWCTKCQDDTKQIVAFVKYESITHTIKYLNRCTKCKSVFKAEASINYWVSVIVKDNNANEN